MKNIPLVIYENLMGAITAQNPEEVKNIIKRYKLSKYLKTTPDFNELLSSSKYFPLTPLLLAIQSSNFEIVEILLESGADINYGLTSKFRRESPLFTAVSKNDLKITKRLLSDMKSPKIDAVLLSMAIKFCNCEMLQLLLNNGGNANDDYIRFDNNTSEQKLIHAAVKSWNVNILNLLLEYGADVDAKDNDNFSPLHWVCLDYHENQFKITQILLDNYANINYEAPIVGTSLLALELALATAEDPRNFLNKELCFDCVKIIIKHIVKLKSLNLFVSEWNLSLINEKFTRSYFNMIWCEEEMAKLMVQRVDNTTISFHDILTKSIDVLAVYAKNPNVLAILDSPNLYRRFPRYAGTIMRNVEKGVKRKLMWEQIKDRFIEANFPEGLNQLPYDCIDQIFKYLSISDLRKYFNIFNN